MPDIIIFLVVSSKLLYLEAFYGNGESNFEKFHFHAKICLCSDATGLIAPVFTHKVTDIM